MLKISHCNTVIFKICAREICGKFVYKYSETIEDVKNQPTFQEIYKPHEQIIREFLGLRKRNFQDIVFISTETYKEIFNLQQCTFKTESSFTICETVQHNKCVVCTKLMSQFLSTLEGRKRVIGYAFYLETQFHLTVNNN